jgi:hypothetical protein
LSTGDPAALAALAAAIHAREAPRPWFGAEMARRVHARLAGKDRLAPLLARLAALRAEGGQSA